MADYKTGMNARALRDLADTFFGKKSYILPLWQEIAENFYPERADFTARRYLGDDYAGNLMTSYPILARRDLTDQVGTMLRNTNQEWFQMIDHRSAGIEDHEMKRWMHNASATMRRAMYAPQTLFTRALALADADFATFGQAGIQVRLNRDGTDLLYRCWHLRDLAWMEDEDGKLCAIWRRWKPTARTLCRLFDDRKNSTVHDKVKRALEKTPEQEFDCLHMMVAGDMYDGKNERGLPWRSIYYDCENQHEMESVAQRRKEYVIPRWLLAQGTQYACSPATVAALPEARLLQAMTYTLLEAGEKIVNPPIVGTEQAVRSDVALMAGGITWLDAGYDERTGAALRPLLQDSRGMPLSQDMQKDSRLLIAQCFYLNKLTLPQRAPQMTAYEVGQRVQQYIRDALPLFEPMEAEYNGGICEETFYTLFYGGAFGSIYDMPRRIQKQGADIGFEYMSPLHDAIKSQKGQKFLEMKQLLAEAVAMDQNTVAVVDAVASFRDALDGIGVPPKWTRSESEVAQMQAQKAAEQQTQALLASLQQGSEIAKNIGAAQASNAQAGIPEAA